MGVTVQLMVDAEVSGVLFTCNPVSGDPSMVAVNASWGLGLAVVGGEVTPDDYLVSKVTGEVVRREISSKHVEYVPDAGGRGTVRVEVAADRQDEPCLGEEELAALVEVAKRVERHFGSHQDVEWALARGRSLPESLVVLQARPVTARPQASTAAVGLGAVARDEHVRRHARPAEGRVRRAARRGRRPRDPAADRRVRGRGAPGRDGGVHADGDPRGRARTRPYPRRGR